MIEVRMTIDKSVDEFEIEIPDLDYDQEYEFDNDGDSTGIVFVLDNADLDDLISWAEELAEKNTVYVRFEIENLDDSEKNETLRFGPGSYDKTADDRRWNACRAITGLIEVIKVPDQITALEEIRKTLSLMDLSLK